MSSFDVGNVKYLLQSKKIKDRNDALNDLELFTQSNMSLSSRNFKLLVLAIIDLIETEVNIYKFKPSIAIENRVTSASGLIKIIVEKTINGTIIKSKVLLDIIKTLIELCNEHFEVLLSSLLEYIITIESILKISYFKDHLNFKDYSILLQFLTKIIDYCTKFNQFEQILIHSYGCLVNLLNCDELSSTVYLQIYKNQDYKLILPLLKNTIGKFTRENITGLYCFKIINKLIVLLSTEDIKSTHFLINLGIDILLMFNSSNSVKLQHQFLIFINLSPLIYFVDLAKFDIVDNDSADSDDPLINKVSMLIQQLVSKLNTLDFEFDSKDFDISIVYNSKISWFNLKSINLSTTNTHPWLLALGIIKLVTIYFNLKLDSNNDQVNILGFSTPSSSKTKRQKLGIIDDTLHRSNHIFEFLNKLIASKLDMKTQKIGLQLLLFYLQWYSPSKSEIEPENHIEIESDFTNETTFNFSFTDTNNFDLNLVLKSTLLTFENIELNLWSLLVSYSLIIDSLVCKFIITNKSLYHLLNISLQALKVPLLSRVACALTHLIVHYIEKQNLFQIIDKQIVNQLDNLMELSDINGPCDIDNASIAFWYAIYGIFINNKSLKMKLETFSIKVQEWTISKWHRGNLGFYNAYKVPDFVAWICGVSVFPVNIENVMPTCHSQREVEEISLLMSDREKFASYLALRDDDSIDLDITLSTGNLKQCKETENFLLSILKSFSTELLQNDRTSNKFQVAVLLIQVAQKFPRYGHYSHIVDSIEHQSIYFLESLQESVLNVNEKIRLVEVFNSFIPSLDVSIGKSIVNYVPIDSYCNEILKQTISKDPQVLKKISMFDDDMKPHQEEDNYQIVNTIVFEASIDPFKEAVYCIFNCFRLTGKDFSGIIPTMVANIKNLPPDHLMTSLVALINQITIIGIDQFSQSSLDQLVRFVGQRILVDHQFERSELTFVSVCKILRCLLPILDVHIDSGFKKDCYDMCNWLIDCAHQSIVTTESGDRECCEFLITFIDVNDGLEVSNEKLKPLVFERIKSSTNFLRSAIVQSLSNLVRKLGGAEQIEYYHNVLMNYPEPNTEVETSASFVHFFCHFSESSTRILHLTIFNLLECSEFPSFSSYLENGLDFICKNLAIFSRVDMFKSIRLMLLKWWLENNDFDSFPYKLFGYVTQSDFFHDNYRELTAIVMAIVPNDSKSLGLRKRIASTRHSDSSTICSESFSLAIPLSFTDKGKKNQIFDELPTYLDTHYKIDLKEKLLMTVFDIIKLTDMSREDMALNMYKSNLVARRILSRNKSDTQEVGARINISLATASQLLSKFIQKYYKDGDFWVLRNTYFLLRRMFIVLNDSFFIDDKVASLKRIKLILILGSKCVHTFEVSRILIHNLCPLLLYSELRDEVLSIFSMLQVENMFQYSLERSVPLVIQLLLSVLSSGVSVKNSAFLSSMEEYIKNINTNNRLWPILNASMEIVYQRPILLSSGDIEEFLKDKVVFSLCSVSNSSDTILSLISVIFSSVRLTESVDFSDILVDILFNASNEVRQNYSKEFQLWTSKYMANFYLEGGLFSEFSKVREISELSGFFIETFIESIKVLDYALDSMIKICDKGDVAIAGCGENILGVLLYKYRTNKDEVQNFLNFEVYLEKYVNYIVPLDVHSCMIMNDESGLEYLGTTLIDILNDFDKFITKDSFSIWTTKLLLAILQEVSMNTSIAPLFSSFAIKFNKYAAEVIPFFISYHINLRGSKGSEFIERLFNEFTKTMSNDESTIELFIRVLLQIRIGSKKGLPVFQNIISSIDLQSFYKLATVNKLPKAALLIFEEIFCDEKKVLDWSLESKNLASVYESLNEVDLIYGIPERTTVDYALSMINRGDDTSNRLRFNSAIFDANIALKSSSIALNSTDSSIISSLSNNGLIGISRIVSESVGAISEEDSFEWAWKLNQWELPIPNKLKGEQSVIYGTLKQINDYPSKSLEVYENTLLSLFEFKDELFSKSMSCKEYSDTLQSWFQTLGVVQSLGDILSYDESNFQSMIQHYSQRTSWFESSDISYSENILQARQVLFQIISKISKQESKSSVDNLWLGSLHELVRYNIASRNSSQLQRIVSSSMLIDEISKSKFKDNVVLLENTEKLAQFHVARGVWSQGITDIPIVMLKDLTSKGNIELPLEKLSVDCTLINATLVGWMSISRQDLSSNIMEKYVLPTAEAVNSIKDLNQMAKVFHLLANFCEKQYKSRNLNEEIDKLEKRVKSKLVEIDKLKVFYSRASVDADEKKRVQRFYGKLKAQCNSEELDLRASKANKERFSMKAVEFYLKSMSTIEDDDEDEDVDKFFALWLELSTNNDLNRKLSKVILDLPSYKLISWSNQLISRLSDEETEFQNVLQNLVFKICSDHPHHTLYQLLSLKIHKDYLDGNADEYKVSKYTAATKVWTRLLNESSNPNRKLLVPIELFCQEALKLAEHKVQRGRSLQLSRLNVGSFWLEDLPAIPPPTMTIPVDKSAKYINIPTMSKVESKVTIATSGLSLPKILTFHLSNGDEHRMLVKFGADDLRQDSIMEQVFEKVNHMLMKDKETRKRNLHIRTYKAIPMGPKSGMIEFVPNSISLIDVIKPYHAKHDNMTLEKARELMRECQSGEKQQRYDVYEEITSKVKPILRHFFFDTFLTPDTWFDSRVTYTHGIATTSIVGHMLGLGDRHCNNILLDQQTGEPIHIDLGVAFDQGKRLPIPETVPFRLTRDIVDGFGVTGVNGVFRKSCEHTFKVLRANTDHILSILDVLRWDPLYSWNISTMKKQRLQDDTTVMGNIVEDGSEAGRAVLTVSDKLFAAGLSVDAAVRELIQEATNPHNLALIYLGWCPFY